MMSEQELALLKQWIPLLIPLMIIQLGLMVAAVYDLAKRPPEQVKGAKIVWLAVIVLVNYIGPIIYFVIGRTDE
jgi:hypothetical protein